MNRAFEGRTGRAFVGQLSEEKALQNAGKLASEAFIMTVRHALVRRNLHTLVQKQRFWFVRQTPTQPDNVVIMLMRLLQVGIGVIAWEYERQARKEQDKKVKEADLQAELRRRRNQELLVWLLMNVLASYWMFRAVLRYMVDLVAILTVA